jgi:hypothetical protein
MIGKFLILIKDIRRILGIADVKFFKMQEIACIIFEYII